MPGPPRGATLVDEDAPAGASPISPPPPPEPPSGLLGPTQISPTPWMQRPVTSLVGLEPALRGVESISGPSGRGAISAAESVTPMSVVEAAPAVLAGVSALAAGPPGWATLGMAALGGAGGVGFKRLGQLAGGVPITDQEGLGRALFPRGIPDSILGDLTELFGEASKQALFEVPGLFLSKILRLGAAPNRVAALAEDLGLPTRPRHMAEELSRSTISGGIVLRKAAARGQTKAVAEAAEASGKLGGPPPIPEESGLRYIRDVKTGFKAEEKAVEKAAKGEHRAAVAAYEQQLKTIAAAKEAQERALNAEMKKAAEDGVAQGLTAAEAEVGTFLQRLAPEAGLPSTVGRAAQKGAKGGIKIARREADSLYAAADELNEGVMVDITAHVQSLQELAEEVMLSPTADPTALVQYTRKLSEAIPSLAQGAARAGEAERLLANVSAGNREGLKKAIEEALGGPEGALTLPYKEARELQKWLGQRLTGKVSGDISQGRLKLTWGSLKDSIEQSVKGTEGGAALAEANAFYSEFADVAKEGAIPILVERFRSTPSDVINLMARGGDRVQQLRKGVVGYAERYGTLKEQASTHEAWDQMGRLFAEEKLLDGGIAKFPERLSSVGAETLDALYGREMANNFRTIASSVRSLRGMDVERIAAGLKAKAPRPTPPEIGPRLPSIGPPPELRPPVPQTQVQQDALQRLSDLEEALRIGVTSVPESRFSLIRYGAGVSIPLRPLLGGAAAGATAGTTEVVGGLVTWAATNRARTRLFRNAAAMGFRVGVPSTLRLINAYLDYQRDMALITERRQGGGPPEQGTRVEITPEKLAGVGIGPPPEPPVTFGFLN